MSESRPVGSVEELYGTWKLISWTRQLLDTGETVEAFGRVPRGFLHYGRDGHVFWVMTTAQVRNLRFEGNRLVMTTDPQSGVDGRRSSSVFVWARPV